ncbi:MAG: hypothetical protein IJV45_09850 [Prevotella sp.]|nr:hypothetical protein [Prevotella sp.]
MTLHIFNPEHDIALAADTDNFTAPHAGRQLRHDLGYLPALWAEAGDDVLVDNVETAENGFRQLMSNVARLSGRPLTTHARWTLKPSADTERVEPWGWDRALCAQLLHRRKSIREVLPTGLELADMRRLSHRSTAAEVLPRLRVSGTVGEAYYCTSSEEVLTLLHHYGRLVLKAPWSSSGRGVRFVDTPFLPTSDTTQSGWFRNVLRRQGSMMAEPYYNKVKDFGMEFSCDEHGIVSYLGLSLFHTTGGAYTGNLLATEERKRQELGRYLQTDLVDRVRSLQCDQLGEVIQGRYRGPLGVDMMIVKSDDADGFLLHPCVEINFRRTMGHVALALERLVNPDADDDVVRVMRIDTQDGNYKLKIQRL